MGTRGMSYSLQSRDLIADQVETAAGGHHLDGMVVVPGCDKNMPGVLMARLYLFSCPRSFDLRLWSSVWVSRPSEPPWFDGVWWDHSGRVMRGAATARYRLCISVIWQIFAGRQNAGSGTGAIQYSATRVSRARGMRWGKDADLYDNTISSPYRCIPPTRWQARQRR